MARSESKPEPFRRELYRTDKTENFRAVALTVEADGAVDLSAQDMGPLVEVMWGDADYEFGVQVKPEHAAALIAALLTELYDGRAESVDELRALLEKHGVPHERWSWA